MNKIYTLLSVLLLTASAFAQSPEMMSYQAIVRDGSDALITNQTVGLQISILQNSISGTAVYVETQTPTSNINGLLTFEIGTGTTTDDFSTIDWSAGPYFIKTETDPTGGTTYTITGTSQLMSVPFALYAKTSGNGEGPIGPQGPAGANGQGRVTSAGTGISVTGAGTVASPYIVSTTSACGLSIGQAYQGGIIFYLDRSGCHGLISAQTDQDSGIPWNDGTFINTKAYGSGLFEGQYNTRMINFFQTGSSFAAAICEDLVLGGYDDWYLPSIEELNKMYQNIGQGNTLGLGNVGGFAFKYYWSSTEADEYRAWLKNFNGGLSSIGLKNQTSYNLRAVRAF